MDILRRLRIGTRLMLSFGLVVVLMVAALSFSLVRLQAVQEKTEIFTGDQAERMALASEWRENIWVNSTRTLAVVVSSDPALLPLFSDEMKVITERTTVIQKRFAELEQTEEGRHLQAELTELRQRYLGARDAALDKKAGGGSVAGVMALAAQVNEFKKIVATYVEASNRLVAFEADRSRANGADIKNDLAYVRAFGIVGVTAATLCALGLGLLLSRSVVGPVVMAQQAAQRIADGDLTGEIRPTTQDESGELIQALGQMQQSLVRIVGEIRSSSESIQVASTEVASGNQDLSQRTEQTASNLQQAASSLDQLTGTVRQSADAAAQANQLAHSASDTARRGGEVVAQVVSTMEDINTSSKKIADIIGVIDGIAFQTNILALNAAVEAARAGEQGRGFAVVAGEVRHLAQRSADAAREIKALIGVSVDRVEDGARLVRDAGQTMGDIVVAVRRVSDIIAEITTAASEQSSGIALVNDSVSQLDQMTQQNAALVEQSAAAAESMRGQARHLSEAVGTFRLRQDAA